MTDDLFNKPHVKNHPLFKGQQQRFNRIRNTINQYNAELESKYKRVESGDKKVDLSNIFSELNNLGVNSEDNRLHNMINKASVCIDEVLRQLDFPIYPKVSYNKITNVKYAANSDDVVSALMEFNVKISTITGTHKLATIPVSVVKGVVVPPSALVFDGRIGVISQSLVDELVNRNTSFYLPNYRGQYDPPLTRDERQMYSTMRNSIGYQPVHGKGSISDARNIVGKKKRSNEGVEAKAPPGKKYEDMIMELKKDPDVDNPFAIAWAQYNKDKKSMKNKKARGSDYEGLKRMIGGVIILKGCVEVDIMNQKDPVHVAIVHDSSGFTPGAALYAGWGGENQALEIAYELLENRLIEDLSDEERKEMWETEEEEGFNPVTEGIYGEVFKVENYEVFVDIIDSLEGWRKEIIQEQMEPLDEEEPEDELLDEEDDFDNKGASKRKAEKKRVYTIEDYDDLPAGSNLELQLVEEGKAVFTDNNGRFINIPITELKNILKMEDADDIRQQYGSHWKGMPSKRNKKADSYGWSSELNRQIYSVLMNDKKYYDRILDIISHMKSRTDKTDVVDLAMYLAEEFDEEVTIPLEDKFDGDIDYVEIADTILQDYLADEADYKRDSIREGDKKKSQTMELMEDDDYEDVSNDSDWSHLTMSLTLNDAYEDPIVSVFLTGEGATEFAKKIDQSIDGNMWESDGPEFAYAMIVPHVGMVDEIKDYYGGEYGIEIEADFDDEDIKKFMKKRYSKKSQSVSLEESRQETEDFFEEKIKHRIYNSDVEWILRHIKEDNLGHYLAKLYFVPEESNIDLQYLEFLVKDQLGSDLYKDDDHNIFASKKESIAKKDKPYWLLLGYASEYDRWEVIFGDYNKQDVQDEKDTADHTSDDYYSKLKIVKSSDDQKVIDELVNSLNDSKIGKNAVSIPEVDKEGLSEYLYEEGIIGYDDYIISILEGDPDGDVIDDILEGAEENNSSNKGYDAPWPTTEREVEALSTREMLDYYLKWNGIMGYTPKLLSFVKGNEKGKKGNRKIAFPKKIPPMYEQVTKDMNDAEENGLDTFPRSYHHILNNYILDRVSTASKDAWEVHLINDGWAINPYGINRGRNRKGL